MNHPAALRPLFPANSGTAIIANEAYEAAADPKKFPEQFKYGVKPWTTRRIFWNTFNFGGNNTTSNDQLKLDAGAFNPLLGKSYGEIASESRSMHKSQGFGVPSQRGPATEFFTLTAGYPVHNFIAEVIVNPLPVINDVTIVQCDDDLDAITAFNLTVNNSQISVDAANETFTYYTSLAGARANPAYDLITNPLDFTNTTPTLMYIWTRVTTVNGCYRVARITLRRKKG